MDKERLEKLKDGLTEIADVLYKGGIDVGIARMNEVIPELAVFASWMTDEDMKSRLVDNALSPLLQAMEDRDATLMADIISYELTDMIDICMD